MNAKDAFCLSMDLSDLVVTTYLSDLSNDDLFVRPVPGVNHIAWQMGHLIASEVHLLQQVVPSAQFSLPDGFAEQHGKEKATTDDRAGFLTKDEYLDWYQKMRDASRQALAALPDGQLDGEAPEDYRSFAPTVGAMINLIASHPMMHAGQFAVVRRKLGKPVLL